METNSDIMVNSNYSQKVSSSQGIFLSRKVLHDSSSVSSEIESQQNGSRPDIIERSLSDRFLITDIKTDGSYTTKCLDKHTKDEYLCKIVPNTGSQPHKILTVYYRLKSGYGSDDDTELVRPLKKVLRSSQHTFLLIADSHNGDLHSYLKDRKRLLEPEARNLFRQICKTIKHCHEQGIILRDLKLRRFVFTDRDRTKLQCESVESAVLLDDPSDDTLHEKIGCPTYVAPELLRINSSYNGKPSDVWSLGVILYTMLVGRYPFNARTPSNLFAKIASGRFFIPPWISSKAKCLLRSLLRQNPAERMQAEDILHHPWFSDDELDEFYIDQEHKDDQCVPEFSSYDEVLEIT